MNLIMKGWLWFPVFLTLVACAAMPQPATSSKETAIVELFEVTPSTYYPPYTPRPTRTPILETATPTRVPTATLTDGPTPTSPASLQLTEHEWHPEDVVISMRISGGDGGFAPAPALLILRNGKAYSYREEVLFENQLSLDELCAILNAIDQAGFFEYDPDVIDYSRLGDGAPIFTMYVSAWSSSNFSLQMPYLDELFPERFDKEAGYDPPILPVIYDVFNILQAVAADTSRSQNQRLVVLVQEFKEEEIYSPPVEWVSDQFQLDAFLSDECEDGTLTVLQPSEASEFRHEFAISSLSPGEYFISEGKIYWVEYQDVLPEQIVPHCGWYIPESGYEFEVAPGSLLCVPEDGLFQP